MRSPLGPSAHHFFDLNRPLSSRSGAFLGRAASPLTRVASYLTATRCTPRLRRRAVFRSSTLGLCPATQTARRARTRRGAQRATRLPVRSAQRGPPSSATTFELCPDPPLSSHFALSMARGPRFAMTGRSSSPKSFSSSHSQSEARAAASSAFRDCRSRSVSQNISSARKSALRESHQIAPRPFSTVFAVFRTLYVTLLVDYACRLCSPSFGPLRRSREPRLSSLSTP